MIDLSAYSRRDLQAAKSVVSQCLAGGLRDAEKLVAEIDTILASDLNSAVARNRSSLFVRELSASKQQVKRCPDCNRVLQLDKRLEGVSYDGCPRCYKVVNVRFE